LQEFNANKKNIQYANKLSVIKSISHGLDYLIPFPPVIKSDDIHDVKCMEDKREFVDKMLTNK